MRRRSLSRLAVGLLEVVAETLRAIGRLLGDLGRLLLALLTQLLRDAAHVLRRRGHLLARLRRHWATSRVKSIMGRHAAYTGQQVTWEQALNSEVNLVPKPIDWKGAHEAPALAQPGRSKVF